MALGPAAATPVLRLVLLLWTCHIGTATASDELATLINARLDYMKDVAAHKWIHGEAITDAERERVVLDAATRAALQHGIAVGPARAFFQAQIAAARDIQAYWFAVWGEGNGPVTAPDLTTEVRPRLLALGNEITSRLKEAAGSLDRSQFLAALEVVGLGEAARNELWQALSQIQVYPDRLAQVLNAGVLRVGTTFDYAPFSYQVDGEPAGIDVDLASDLARSLGVRAEFIQTSWPGLMKDLAAGQYDIAMSGVSISLDRQRHGYFSPHYHSGGKTPIARCGEAQALGSLDALDRKGVRVIVNPGGTNERFVDEHITRATKILYPDNRDIFDQLIAGSADVMITDSIEVQLQTARHDELCPTMPDSFRTGTFLTRVDKGYLMPQDMPLKEYVTLWLDLRIADGTVARVFNQHLAGH